MLRVLFSCLALIVWMLAGTASAQDRELAVAEDELIDVELATVAVVPGQGVPVVLLREPEMGEVVPIFIGPAEARAILLAQRGMASPRPMTHDLLANVIERMGGTLERIVVDALRDGTYHGALEVRMDDDSLLRIDARPSDALALAVRTGAGIAVAPDVLEAGRGTDFEGLGREQVVTAVGITVVEATAELREALELPDRPGVLVSAAEGVAAMAGVQSGAMVLSVNGQPPETPMAFLEAIQQTPQGEKAELELWFEGEEREVSVPTDVPDRGRQPTLEL